MTNRQIVIVESDSQSLLTALQTAASLSQEHGASLHERAASIRGGWVHDGFKPTFDRPGTHPSRVMRWQAMGTHTWCDPGAPRARRIT